MVDTRQTSTEDTLVSAPLHAPESAAAERVQDVPALRPVERQETQPVRSAETVRRITEADDAESWWDRYQLIVAAVGCWTFLVVALVARHVLEADETIVVGCFVLAYAFGGTFATIAA